MTTTTTVTIQIGNSDNKLSQDEWHRFVETVNNDVIASGVTCHFFGAPPGYAQWQNVVWVVEGSTEVLAILRRWVIERRTLFHQDSAA